jgi:serine/threonine protein phosphatase PrpC
MSLYPEKTTESFSDQEFAAQFFVPKTTPLRVEFGAASNVGLVRKNNEDHFAVVRRRRSQEVMLSNLPPGTLAPSTDTSYCFIVADGMGGAAAGEWASRLALQTAWDLAGQASSWVMRFRDLSAQQIRERAEAFASAIHRTLLEYGRADADLRGMGTTWTSAYVVGWDALLTQVGDSRAYVFRRGDLSQITHDQTLAQELIDSGIPPEKTRGVRNVLTNTLGGRRDTVSPEVEHLVLEDGDRLLLCTDGLSELVSDDEIAELVGRDLPAQAACDALVQLALDHGGKDNVTSILAEFSADERNPST